MVPEIKAKDVDILLKETEFDAEILHASEEVTAMWISSYLDEISRVESFFEKKLESLITEFILMQDKFRLKSELYETEQLSK
jgi:hypothetical protein